MDTETAVLYDQHGNTVKKSVPQTQPGFLQNFAFNTSAGAVNIQKEPYRWHTWLYATVDRIKTNVACLPHILIDKSKKKSEDTVIEEHEILDLFMRPNPYMKGTELWEAIVLYLHLPTVKTPGGQCFIVGEMGNNRNADFRNGDIPKELYIFSDVSMHPRYNGNRQWVGYKLTLPNNATIDYSFNEVICIKFYNPYRLEHGMAPAAAAQISMIQDAHGDEFNTRYYDNMGFIGGLLTTDQDLTKDQMYKYRSSWEQQYGGSGNAGKTAMLGSGMKYDQMILSNIDMQFMEQRKDNRTRMQAVNAIPDAEIAIYESGMNRATAETADRSVWQKKYLPVDKKIWQSLNITWIKHIKPYTLRGASDYSTVEALKPDLTRNIENAERLWKMKVPIAEALRVTGINVDVDKYSWMDKAFGKTNDVDMDVLVEEGYIAKTQNTNSTAGKMLSMPFEEAVLSMVSGKVSKEESDEAKKEERLKGWDNYVEQVLDPGEKSIKPIFVRQFQSDKRKMMDNVDIWLKDQTKDFVRQIVVDPTLFLFDLDESNIELEEEYTPKMIAQMRREEKYLKENFGDAITWGTNEDNIDKMIKSRRKFIKEINTTTFNAARMEINDTVKVGIDEGWTPQQLAKQLKESISDVAGIRVNNANTIARTEVGAISNEARYKAFKTSNVVEKQEWLTARDEYVRPSHQIDGQIREIGKTFSNGLRYPHDPYGSGAETINCVLSDTIIEGNITGALKANYSGKAVKIKTSRGNRLSVTINHPIFTDKGIVPAHKLCEGDNVICNSGNVGVGSSGWNKNTKKSPTRVQDVFNSIKSHGTSVIHRPSAFDLDCDGQFVKGNIDTVKVFNSTTSTQNRIVDSKLSDIGIPSSSEHVGDFKFISSDRSDKFPTGSPLVDNGTMVFGSASGNPSVATLPANSNRVLPQSSPFKIFSFGLASDMSISRYQYSTYDISGYMEFLGDLILTHAGLVEVDNIVSVEIFDFVGHVYDLQTTVGYFSSNNIISRNCRCVALPVFDS